MSPVSHPKVDSSVRGHWCQCRLRTILVATAVIAFALVPLADRLAKARQQRLAVAEIQRYFDADVYYDLDDDDGTSQYYESWRRRSSPSPPLLHRVFGADFFNSVITVTVRPEQVDVMIPYLKRLRHLRTIWVMGWRDGEQLESVRHELRRALPNVQEKPHPPTPVVG